MFKKLGLQVKLPVIIFILFYLPLLALSIFVYEYSRINDENHLVSMIEQKIDARLDGFNSLGVEALSNMTKLADLPEISELNHAIENSRRNPKNDPEVLSKIKNALTAFKHFKSFNDDLMGVRYFDPKTEILIEFDRKNLKSKIYSFKDLSGKTKKFYKNSVKKIHDDELTLLEFQPFDYNNQTKMNSSWMIGYFKNNTPKGILIYDWNSKVDYKITFPLAKKSQKPGWLLWNDKSGKGILNDASLYRENKSINDLYPELPHNIITKDKKILWDEEGNLLIFNDILKLLKQKLKEVKVGFSYTKPMYSLYHYPNKMLSKEINEFRDIILYFIFGQILIFTPFLIFFLIKSKEVVSGLRENLNKTNEKISGSSGVIDQFTENLTVSHIENLGRISRSVESVNLVGQKFFKFKNRISAGRDKNAENIDLLSTTKETFKNLENSLDELTKSSLKVENITTFMNDMAFKTNLLALNASVEAARAGEGGKGFAVVAKAIRELAENSSSATKEISKIVKENTKKSKEGREQAHKGHELLSTFYKNIEIGKDWIIETFVEIEDQVGKMDQLKSELSDMQLNMQKTRVEAETLEKLVPELKKESVALNDVTTDINNMIKGES